jgi:hypothetical protein
MPEAATNFAASISSGQKYVHWVFSLGLILIVSSRQWKRYINFGAKSVVSSKLIFRAQMRCSSQNLILLMTFKRVVSLNYPLQADATARQLAKGSQAAVDRRLH